MESYFLAFPHFLRVPTRLVVVLETTFTNLIFAHILQVNGPSLLMVATECANVQLIRELARRGADINYQDSVSYCHWEFFKSLVAMCSFRRLY